MGDVQTRLGARVREFRTRRDWTQEKLGEQAGLSYKFIGEIERGIGNPTIDSIEQIARAFGIDVGDLFRREPEVTYPAFSARDVAEMRDARQSLSSIDELLKRLDATAKPRPKRRSKSR